MRLRAETEAAKSRDLQAEIQRRNQAIEDLAEQKRAAENESAETKRQRVIAVAAAQSELSVQRAELGAVKGRLQAMEEAETRRNQNEMDARRKREKRSAFLTYLASLAFVLFVSAVSAWQTPHYFRRLAKLLGERPLQIFVVVVIFVLGHLVLELIFRRKSTIAKLWPFRLVKRLRRFLWVIVLLGFFSGVAGNLYANWVQKHLDSEHQTTNEK